MQTDVTIMVSLALLWMLVLFNLVLTLGLSRRVNTIFQNSQKIESLRAGEVMPSFETQTINGELIGSSSLSGNYAAIIFLSPDCTPCIEEFPRVLALGQKLAGSKIKLTMISIGDARETESFLQDHAPNFPIISASFDDSLVRELKAYTTPFFYLFNPSGKVESLGSDLDNLEHELTKIGILN